MPLVCETSEMYQTEVNILNFRKDIVILYPDGNNCLLQTPQ